ncbi:hypothetical protein [Halomonas sp. RT37]|uniref:YecA family protein n=1 Tax=Halomonas sp. RT37 TaxID=2950872 RepID=A0AAU7KFU8_9GAMM
MRNDEINRLVSSADEAWAQVTDAVPIDENWGMFSYGDAPAALGGGFGAFAWFEDRASMLKFIEEVLPFSPRGPDNRDPLPIMDAVSAVIKDIRNDSLSLEQGREKLNKELEGCSQIEWWGTFRELRGGISPYSRKLINKFRQHLTDDENINEISTGPISDNELAEFKDYLMTYGV